MADNKEQLNEQYEKELQELRDTYERRSVLNPDAAKKVLVVAIVVFVVLVIVGVLKWTGMF